jgi:hypothetical protein
MSQSQAQPGEEQAIQDFISWVEKNRANGRLGSSDTVCLFMPLQLLESHLKAPRRLRQILSALFPGNRSLPIQPDDILHLDIVRIFAILILIDKGRYIKTIAHHPNIKDKFLPFLEEPRHFPRLADGDTSIWSAFYKKQFQFCPHLFTHVVTDTELEDDTILPIITKEPLPSGGSATICKIKLHAEYDHLPSKDQQTQVFTCPRIPRKMHNG